MVVVGGSRVEQTHFFMIFRNNQNLHMFGEVFVDLVLEVAEIFQKLPQTLGVFGPMGPSL